MRAVLVGLIGKDKLFYDLDAGPSEKDGIVEKENGITVKVDFLSFSSGARGLNKIRSSTFHRFLWDAPRDILGGAWYESFVQKTRPLKDEILEKIKTHSSLGKNRDKLKAKSESVDEFVHKTLDADSYADGCCGEMIQFKNNKYKFLSFDTRKVAWEAMNILREIEDK